MKYAASLVAVLAVATACSNSPQTARTPTPDEWVGTWRLNSITCTPNTGAIIQGATIELVLRETTGDTIVTYSNGCKASMLEYTITPVPGGIDFPTSTSKRVECEPNPCVGVTKITEYGRTQEQRQKCPDDFPPVLATGKVIGVPSGDFISAKLRAGSSECEYRYTRVR